MTIQELKTTPWIYVGNGDAYRHLHQVVFCDDNMTYIAAWTHPAHGKPDDRGYSWRGSLEEFVKVFRAVAPTQQVGG